MPSDPSRYGRHAPRVQEWDAVDVPTETETTLQEWDEVDEHADLALPGLPKPPAAPAPPSGLLARLKTRLTRKD
ncbi:MAG: hypothetical protein JWQ08_597 [Deinococcus sp.]|nr:hypothetical protein [Deinococcus sp.]